MPAKAGKAADAGHSQELTMGDNLKAIARSGAFDWLERYQDTGAFEAHERLVLAIDHFAGGFFASVDGMARTVLNLPEIVSENAASAYLVATGERKFEQEFPTTHHIAMIYAGNLHHYEAEANALERSWANPALWRQEPLDAFDSFMTQSGRSIVPAALMTFGSLPAAPASAQIPAAARAAAPSLGRFILPPAAVMVTPGGNLVVVTLEGTVVWAIPQTVVLTPAQTGGLTLCAMMAGPGGGSPAAPPTAQLPEFVRMELITVNQGMQTRSCYDMKDPYAAFRNLTTDIGNALQTGQISPALKIVLRERLLTPLQGTIRTFVTRLKRAGRVGSAAKQAKLTAQLEKLRATESELTAFLK